eukprot:8926344-Pyramimonas_sp.AAC.1
MGVKDYTGLSEPYQTGGCTRNHNGTSPSFLLYEHSHSRAKHNSSEYKIAPSLTVRHSKDTIAKRCATMRAITRYASAWLPRYSESVENIDAMVKKQGERFRKESGCALRKASETEGSVCRQVTIIIIDMIIDMIIHSDRGYHQAGVFSFLPPKDSCYH